jgi:hypothetical protein
MSLPFAKWCLRLVGIPFCYRVTSGNQGRSSSTPRAQRLYPLKLKIVKRAENEIEVSTKVRSKIIFKTPVCRFIVKLRGD